MKCAIMPRALTVLIFLLIPEPSRASDTLRLSMNESWTQAREHNPKIRQYREKAEQKIWDRRTARGNFLPTATLGLGYTINNDPLTMDLDPLRSAMIGLQSYTLTRMAVDSFVRANGGSVPAATINAFQLAAGRQANASLEAAVPHFIDTLKKKSYPSGNLTLSQPLFMGGRIVAGAKAASAESRAAAAELTRIENEVTQETFNAYCSVALLGKVLLVRQDVVDGMTRHQADAERLCTAGMIPKTGLLRARVAVAEAARMQAADKNRLLLAKLALGRCLDLPDTVTIDICDSLSAPAAPGDVAAWLSRADTTQPLLAWIQTRRDAAHAKVMAERGSLLPRLVAYGRVEIFQNDLSALEPAWSTGLSMNMDIFAGGKNISKRASAEHLERESEAAAEGAHRDVRLWVHRAFIECSDAASRVDKLTSDAALGEENLRQCQERFTNGYGTAIEVIDAELALEKIRIESLTATYDWHRSYMDLCTAAGEPQHALALLSGSKEINQ